MPEVCSPDLKHVVPPPNCALNRRASGFAGWATAGTGDIKRAAAAIAKIIGISVCEPFGLWRKRGFGTEADCRTSAKGLGGKCGEKAGGDSIFPPTIGLRRGGRLIGVS